VRRSDRRRNNLGTVPRWQGRGWVNARSNRMCELHGDHLGHSFSHRKPASLGGGWEPPNGLRACGDGTTLGHGWIEANPDAAELLGWRVPSWRNPLGVPAFIWSTFGQGWVLLGDDGSYISEGAVERALALDLPEFPEVPVLPEWAEWSKT
jgi:hypothetical protein